MCGDLEFHLDGLLVHITLTNTLYLIIHNYFILALKIIKPLEVNFFFKC
jgi:hypothetical protein